LAQRADKAFKSTNADYISPFWLQWSALCKHCAKSVLSYVTWLSWSTTTICIMSNKTLAIFNLFSLQSGLKGPLQKQTQEIIWYVGIGW
jgi:hypothetical protein